MSRMGYGGERRQRGKAVKSPLTTIFWGQQRVGLGFRSGAILRHAPTPSCHPLSAAHGWLRRVCSGNKVCRSLLCSPGSKIKNGKDLATWACGKLRHSNCGEQASVPTSWARAPWQRCFMTRLSMGFWQRAGHCQKGSIPT